MRLFLQMGFPALVALVMGSAGSSEPLSPPEAGVQMKVVKYPDLSKIIAQHVGEVVVVDFWSVGCAPCRQKFPHLVEMHRKYAREGLIALSVSLDEDAQKKEVQEEVLTFLREQKATFTNLLLDEPYEVWRDKFDIASPPCVIVFGRDGRWRKFDADALDGDHGEGEAKIEKLVEQWLDR